MFGYLLKRREKQLITALFTHKAAILDFEVRAGDVINVQSENTDLMGRARILVYFFRLPKTFENCPSTGLDNAYIRK